MFFLFFTFPAMAGMKTLVLVRHAKSSWDDFSLSDFERPLNERGKRDAPMMARRIKSALLVPDALVSSSAIRARKTAEAFARELGMDGSAIRLTEALYLASPDTIGRVVSSLDDQHQTVAIFAHNPGITDFANQLGVARIDDMPTCAVYAVSATVDHWLDFLDGAKSFRYFDYPKNPAQG